MAEDDRQWAQAAAGPGAAVLVAQLDARHTLTPLHADSRMRQAAEALSAALAQPPREQLLPLAGEGFALTAHDTQPLVDAARRLRERLPADTERSMGFRFGVHALGDARAPRPDELAIAQRVAAAAPYGGVCLSAEAVDRLTQPWALPLQDRGRASEEPEDALRLFGLDAEDPATQAPRLADLGPTLAVLTPDLGPAAGPGRQQAVAEMAADALIVALSQSSQLRVVSHRSSQGLRHSRQALNDAFEHLQAHYVLQCRGSLGLSERVFLQLTLHARGQAAPLWQGRAEFELVDLLYGDTFPLSQACADIHTVLQTSALQAAKRQPWEKLEHFQLMNAATQLMHKLSPAAFAQSRAMLDHLHAQLPNHPEPLAWLAQWHMLEIAQGASTQVVAPQALALAEQALALDPQHSLSHALAGHAQAMLGQAAANSAAHHQAALAANPNNGLAWLFHALHQTYQGRTQAACEAAKLALALSPLDPWRYFMDSVCAHALLANNQVEAGLAHAMHSARLNAQHGPTLIYLVVAYARLGQLGQADEALTRLLQRWPGYTVNEFRTAYWGRDTEHAETFTRALTMAGLPNG
jgi:tetratricopeptide (TPR) repeat protein